MVNRRRDLGQLGPGLKLVIAVGRTLLICGEVK